MAIGAATRTTKLQFPTNTPSTAYQDVQRMAAIYLAHDDARTEQSAIDLLNPLGIDDSVFHWVETPAGANFVSARARYPIATTAVGQAPVVELVGLRGDPSNIDRSGGPTTDGTVECVRLDASTWNAARLLLVTDATPVTTDSHNDATYFYSEWTSRYALQGCNFVGVPVDTASQVAITASAAVGIELRFTAD